MKIPGIPDKALPLIGIVFVAVVVRLALLLFLHDSYYTAGMAQGELARNLVEGRGFVVNVPFSRDVGALQQREHRLVDIDEGLRQFSPEDRPQDFRPFIAYMMPGQGILLAGMNFLTGVYRYVDLQVLQAILDACAVLLIFAVGRELFGRRTGIIAALLYAVYIPSARLAISATRDAWMPMVFVLICYFLAIGWKRRQFFFFVAAGVAVGVGSYFRSEILLVPVAIAPILLFLDSDGKRLARWAVVGMIPVVLLILPWSIRNYEVFHRIIPTNSGLWLAMWQSFGEYSNEFGAVNNDAITMKQMRAEGHTEEFDTPEYDKLFEEKVLNVLSDHPLWFSWTVVRRLARMPLQMHAWGIPQTDDLSTAVSDYPTGTVDVGLYWKYLLANPWRAIVQLAVRGINALLYLSVVFFFLRRGHPFWKEGVIVALLPLYNIAVHAIIGVHARYILPTNALLLVFVAVLLSQRKVEKSAAPSHQ